MTDVYTSKEYKSRGHLQTGGVCVHNARLKLQWQPAKGSCCWAMPNWPLPWAPRAAFKPRSQEKPYQVGSHMAVPGCRAHFVHDRSIYIGQIVNDQQLVRLLTGSPGSSIRKRINLQAYLIAARLGVQSSLRTDAQIGADRYTPRGS